MSYKLLADLHTHSLASIHAYNTVDEILTVNAHLPYIAITDHVQVFKDDTYMNNIIQYTNSMRSQYRDVEQLIVGAEIDVNIPAIDAGVDLGQLDISILSYHENGKLCLQDYITYIEEYHPTILGHPYRYAKTKEDIRLWDEIVSYAVEKGLVIEINECSVKSLHVKHLQSLNATYSLGSDAHCSRLVGKLGKAEEFVASYLNPQQVVNYDTGWLQDARAGKFKKHNPMPFDSWAEKSKFFAKHGKTYKHFLKELEV